MREIMFHLKRMTVVGTLSLLLAIWGCSTTEPMGQQVGDAAITTKIKSKYTGDPEIHVFNINVTTNEGVVTLMGRVKSTEVKMEAEKLAKQTEGVKKVVNMINVGPE